MKPKHQRQHQRRNIGGYLWSRQMAQALDGNDQARDTLAAIHDHIRAANCASQVNLLLLSQLLTDAILSLDRSKSALIELRTIAEAQKRALAGASLPSTGPARSVQPGEASPADAPPTTRRYRHENHNRNRRTAQD
jgi:hypothetical protein